jgi:hypothetical protein
MPDLDFALVCDYVRADGGVAHCIGGGFDTVYVQEVPTGHNMGIWARILVARSECGRPHRLEVIVQAEDGERAAQIAGPFEAAWPEDHPAHWAVGVGLAFNIGVPLPRAGLYSVEILINDSLAKSIPLRVVAQA